MEAENPTRQKPDSSAIEYRRVPDDEFFDGYANNVSFESSAWDLRIIFGKLDQSKGPNIVVQHSAMTLPWSQVKAGLHFLQIHLAVQESLNGKVHVPKGVIKPPLPPTEDQEKQFPDAGKVFEIAQEIFRRFSEANPESF